LASPSRKVAARPIDRQSSRPLWLHRKFMI
jgi:hypothetical protein